MKRVLKTATWLIPFCKHVNLKQRGKERQVIVISDWKKKSISKLFSTDTSLEKFEKENEHVINYKKSKSIMNFLRCNKNNKGDDRFSFQINS
jgi:hypothetical protein